MAENEPIAFGPKAVDQIAKTVREVARRMRNETPQRGRWQQRPSGGGSDFMWFTILEVHCPTEYDPEEYLICEPLYVPGSCTKTPPGAEDDGTYKFYELCGDGFDGQVADDLPNTIGNGHYVYPWQAETCEPKWVINLLCNLPECGGNA